MIMHNQYNPFRAEILCNKFQHHEVLFDNFEDIILQINLINSIRCINRVYIYTGNMNKYLVEIA